MKEKLINCNIIIEIELIDKIVGGNQFYEIYRSGASGIHGPLRCTHGR